MDGLFNPTGVPVWVTVNKLNLVPNRKVFGLVGVFRNTAFIHVTINNNHIFNDNYKVV